jgi:hypothetical protein
LFNLSPTDTPFLSMAGGMNGGEATQNKLFSWQSDDLAAPDIDGVVEDGTPTYTARSRVESTNVVQIFYRGVEITYSGLGNLGYLAADAGTAGGTDANGQPLLGTNPVTAEMARQLVYKTQEIKRSVELAFLTGTYVNPATDAAARKTRGILPAIGAATTIALDSGAAAPADLAGDRISGGTNSTAEGTPVGDSYIDNLLLQMYDADAPLITPVVFCNSWQKIAITRAYSADGSLSERSRTIGGLSVDQILTDFGWVSIVLDRWMPTDELLIADMSVVKPVLFEVPGMGVFFTEQKPSDGSSIKMAIYGEIGLNYGPAGWHGKITNLIDS